MRTFNGTILTLFISVGSALDFNTSNQSILNYWGGDLVSNLLVKNSLSSSLKQEYDRIGMRSLFGTILFKYSPVDFKM